MKKPTYLHATHRAQNRKLEGPNFMSWEDISYQSGSRCKKKQKENNDLYKRIT